MRYPLYSSDENDTWRYVLGTVGVRSLFVVGLNPHKATQTESDRTVAKAEQLALDSGYDSFVMLNLYPVRSRTVADLPVQPKTTAVARNREAMLTLLRKYVAPHILLAWGDDLQKRMYLREAASHLITQAQPLCPSWHCLGPLTKRGNPRHLSRASNSWNLGAFDAESYIS